MVDDGIEPATGCRQYVRVRRQPESDIHRLRADECISRSSGPTKILLILCHTVHAKRQGVPADMLQLNAATLLPLAGLAQIQARPNHP